MTTAVYEAAHRLECMPGQALQDDEPEAGLVQRVAPALGAVIDQCPLVEREPPHRCGRLAIGVP